MICILDECVQLLQCVIQCSTELRQCIGNRHGGWTTSSFTDFFLFSVLLCSVLFMQYVLINLVSFLISFIFIRIRLFLFHIDMQLCGVSFVFLHLHHQHHHPGWFAFLFIFFFISAIFCVKTLAMQLGHTNMRRVIWEQPKS